MAVLSLTIIVLYDFDVAENELGEMSSKDDWQSSKCVARPLLSIK